MVVCRGVGRDECALSHEKQKESSPMISRFFKIMFGSNFPEVLYLPPEFAQTVDHLTGQETQIEDSCGERWPVTLSYVDGSLAFQKGWPKFCVDHDLEGGHFLIFNYIDGSHFTVQIYGASACERTNFNYGSSQLSKGSRGKPEIIPEDELFKTMNDGSSRDKWRNHQTHLEGTTVDVGRMQISTNTEDPTCMINRDDGYNGESWHVWSGLSIFEMENKPQDLNRFEKASDTQMGLCHPEFAEYANKTRKVTSAGTGTTEQTKTKTQGDGSPVPQIHTTDGVDEYSGDSSTDNSEEALYARVSTSDSDSIEQPVTRRQDDSKKGADNIEQPVTRRHDSKKGADSMEMDAGCSSDTSGMEQDRNSRRAVVCTSYKDSMEQPRRMRRRRRAAKKDVICTSDTDSMEMPKTTRTAAKKDVFHTIHGWSSDKYEKTKSAPDTRTMEQPKRKGDDILNIQHGKELTRRRKCDHSCDMGPIDDTPSSFSVQVESWSYLALPIDIPSVPGRRERVPEKVIYLKVEAQEICPVLYTKIYHTIALTINWGIFCKKNHIRPGDECRFHAENAMPCAYRVEITHKSRSQ